MDGPDPKSGESIAHRFMPSTGRGDVTVTVDGARFTYASRFETADIPIGEITLVELRLNPPGAVGRRNLFHLVVHGKGRAALKITNDQTRDDEDLAAVDRRFFTFVDGLARAIRTSGHDARFQFGNPPLYYFTLVFAGIFGLAAVLFGTVGFIALGVKMVAGALFAAGMAGWCYYLSLNHKPEPARAEDFFYDNLAGD